MPPSPIPASEDGGAHPFQLPLQIVSPWEQRPNTLISASPLSPPLVSWLLDKRLLLTNSHQPQNAEAPLPARYGAPGLTDIGSRCPSTTPPASCDQPRCQKRDLPKVTLLPREVPRLDDGAVQRDSQVCHVPPSAPHCLWRQVRGTGRRGRPVVWLRPDCRYSSSGTQEGSMTQ